MHVIQSLTAKCFNLINELHVDHASFFNSPKQFLKGSLNSQVSDIYKIKLIIFICNIYNMSEYYR